jgi:DNA-binding transcriptional ArsR family regulator
MSNSRLAQMNMCSYFCAMPIEPTPIAPKMNAEKIGKIANVLKTIAHPVRLSILEVLDDRKSMSVTELMAYLGIEQSLLSHHLSKMKDRGILNASRDGKNIYYTLAEDSLTKIFDCLGNCDLVK